MLVAADATDPVASGSALGALGQVVQTALAHDRDVPDSGAMPFEIRTHARYNPAGATQLNIVPGLVGTILTMTMLIFTALSVTREIERGTMENLLSMPITPVEIMLGKIMPYILVGFVQASLIIGIGVMLFGVPIVGSLALLAALSTLFIATNLSIGYTFSTIAQNQLQAMQMSMMFFLPNILLSGFMFPFAGMPIWAQWIGEALPLTHYLRIVRAIMLKGSTIADLRYDAVALFVLMLVAMTIAAIRGIRRFFFFFFLFCCSSGRRYRIAERFGREHGAEYGECQIERTSSTPSRARRLPLEIPIASDPPRPPVSSRPLPGSWRCRFQQRRRPYEPAEPRLSHPRSRGPMPAAAA